MTPQPTGPGHLLVVDDDPDTRANLADVLGLDGYQVTAVGTASAALDAVRGRRFAAVLLDRRLPDGSAETLLPRLRALAPDSPVLIVTGLSDLEGAIEALRQGAADYILKPVKPDVLRAQVGERLRLAAERKRTDAAFRTLVEIAPCLISIVGPDDRILYFNEYGERLSGWRAAEVVGRDVFDALLPEADRAGARAQARRNIRGLSTRNYEARLLPRDGSPRAMMWNAELIPDYHGGPAILVVAQDITDLKRAQEQAVQAARLAAIGQMVTGLAHESGNALARSQACLEMLALEVQDRPEALDLIRRIQVAQDHLRHLYEEVRGYAAPLKLDREACDLRAVWRQAWANLGVQRQGRDAQLSECGEGGPRPDLACAVDLFRMEQVFRNILENALAACRDPVRIHVCAGAAELEGRAAVRVVVRDNGPGLTADQRQRIFEPFYTTKTKGTGLGMPIARRIVEAHGGTIGLGEPDGPGAAIVLFLPREVP